MNNQHNDYSLKVDHLIFIVWFASFLMFSLCFLATSENPIIPKEHIYHWHSWETLGFVLGISGVITSLVTLLCKVLYFTLTKKDKKELDYKLMAVLFVFSLLLAATFAPLPDPMPVVVSLVTLILIFCVLN